MNVRIIKDLAAKVFEPNEERPEAGVLYRHWQDGNVMLITYVGEMVNEHTINVHSITNGKISDHPVNLDWFSTRYKKLC